MKILVSVISYNEESNIEKTLLDLMEHNTGYDIVVIDNGSYDNTTLICNKLGIDVVSHCTNSGSSSGTLMSYFLYAYKNDYDVLCQFDGDGQHIASELHKIIEPILKNEADCVIGSRFISKEGFQSHCLRRMGIRLFSAVDSAIMGQKLTDVTSGFRAYSRRLIEFFGKHYRHEIFDNINQFLILSHFSGARILEVPVVMRKREHGVSQYNVFQSLIFPIKGFVTIVGCLLQRNEVRKMSEMYNGN